MNRMDVGRVIKSGHLSCTECGNKDFVQINNHEKKSLECSDCKKRIPVVGGVPLFAVHSGVPGIKKDIQSFWGHLYDTVYFGDDRVRIKEELEKELLELERLFKHRQHLAAIELPVDNLTGKRVLEIGSGAGAHSAYMASKGARMFSIDLTLERVLATGKKLDLCAVDDCFAIQGDAEKLPFPDCHFDIVYSNGVLHHTPDTQKTIQEVYRVLKPGGKSVIMLYARDSFLYWFNLFLVKGLLMGNIFRSRQWLGKTTEWMSDKRQTVYNPETKVFSRPQIKKLFSSFEKVKIRKNSFNFDQIPYAGRYVSHAIGKFTGHNPAGKLVYGMPWRLELPIELWLGKRMGFGLNIMAEKS